MTKSCQNLFISALIILQLLTPWVHAHAASNHNSHFRFHLAGLEFALKHDQAYFTRSGIHLPFDEGGLVAVCSGINQNPASILFQYQDQVSDVPDSLTTPFVESNFSDNASHINLTQASPFSSLSARSPPRI